MTYVDAGILNLVELMCRKFQVLTGKSNVWLAFQLTNLSIVVYFLWAVLTFLVADFAVRVFVAMFCTGVLYLLTQTVFKDSIELYENSAYRRVAKGFANPRRVRDAMLRISFLFLTIAMSVPAALLYNNFRVRVVLLPYSLVVLTTVVLYLLACDPLPPGAAKVKVWLQRTALSAVPRRVPERVDRRGL